jgi:hypothetical protein
MRITFYDYDLTIFATLFYAAPSSSASCYSPLGFFIIHSVTTGPLGLRVIHEAAARDLQWRFALIAFAELVWRFMGEIY